jgi:hypothetical protein
MAVPGACRIASALLLATACVHVALVPSYAHEAMYLGALFLIAGLSAFAVGLQLWRYGDRSAWSAGSVLCTGMMVGFIVSRTVGLPAYKTAGVDPAAVFSLVAESGFLLLALLSLRGTTSTGIPPGRASDQATPHGSGHSSAVTAHGAHPHALLPAPPRRSQWHRDTVAGHEPSLPQ